MMTKGRAWKFGDDIDTDLILPARFLNLSSGQELAKVCFLDFRPEFPKEISPGDVIVAGRNFGCGSSREHAPLAIKSAGVSVVIAASFARIFYRNAFNIGLPLLESAEACERIRDGERLQVDLAKGSIKSLETGETIRARPIPEFMQKLVESGGLVEYIKKNKIQKEKRV
ncbi:MAG: 3-isopropylmalate dehydratase small subunit [Syntrophaceae bacterium]